MTQKAEQTRSDLITTALHTNIKFKLGEVNAVRAKTLTRISTSKSKAYTSATRGFLRDDLSVLSAMLRSILNIDQTSELFTSMSDTNDTIYLIFNEISNLILQEKAPASSIEATRENKEDIQHYTEVYKVYSVIPKDGTQATTVKRLLQELNAIISKVPFYSQLNTRIRNITTKGLLIKDILAPESNLADKQTREAEQHLENITNQLELLKDYMEDATLPVTIFISVTFPFFKDGERLFEYKCGHCGKVHYLSNPPMLIHYMNLKETYDYARLNDPNPDPISSMALTFDPVVCPDCDALNLFTESTIKQLKALVLIEMNSGCYRTIGRDPVSELALANEKIRRAFIDSPTEVGASIPEPPASISNPLDSNYELHVNSYINWVSTSKSSNKLYADINRRNICWLRSLYNIYPSAEYATDEFSFVISMLVNAGYDLASIQLISSHLHQLNLGYKLSEITKLADSAVGDIVYKDIRVGLEIPNNVESMQDSISCLLDSEQDLGDNFNTIIQNISERCKGIDFSQLTIKSYKLEDFTDVRNQDILYSGLLQTLWCTFKDKYLEALINTATSIIMKQPSSPLFLQGIFGLSTKPEKIRDKVKSLRAKVGKSKDISSLEKPEQLIKDSIDSIMSISSASNFFNQAGTLPFICAQFDIKPTIPYGCGFVGEQNEDDKVDDYLVRSAHDCFGLEIPYSIFLTGKDMEYIISKPKESFSAEQWTGLVYLVGYLFAKCVPTSNHGWKVIQRNILKYFEDLYLEERTTLESMGISYI